MRLKSALLATFLVALVATIPAQAEETATLRLELSDPQPEPFAVENLAGSMRIVPGSGERVQVVATVHAEDRDLLDTVRLEQVTGDKGITTLRVVYPTDRHGTFRYPASARSGNDSWFGKLFSGGGSNNTTAKYGGRKVRVRSGSGVLLYADLEVRLPSREVEGRFRNVVGRIHAEGVEGTLTFDGASADITLESLHGRISADTASGDVKAAEIEGSFSCDTGSGDCDLTGFAGSDVSCDVGSGDVQIRDASARRISADTGSGDVSVVDTDVEEFAADTGSGDVTLEVDGSRLLNVNADTGSGDVMLRLGPEAEFEAEADLSSGDIVSRYSDAEYFRRNGIEGFRRGSQRIRIDVGTGSGDLTLAP